MFAVLLLLLFIQVQSGSHFIEDPVDFAKAETKKLISFDEPKLINYYFSMFVSDASKFMVSTNKHDLAFDVSAGRYVKGKIIDKNLTMGTDVDFVNANFTPVTVSNQEHNFYDVNVTEFTYSPTYGDLSLNKTDEFTITAPILEDAVSMSWEIETNGPCDLKVYHYEDENAATVVVVHQVLNFNKSKATLDMTSLDSTPDYVELKMTGAGRPKTFTKLELSVTVKVEIKPKPHPEPPHHDKKKKDNTSLPVYAWVLIGVGVVCCGPCVLLIPVSILGCLLCLLCTPLICVVKMFIPTRRKKYVSLLE